MQRKQQHPRCRSGAALISALFITAIAAMIATALAVQQRLLIHEGELVMYADQSYYQLQAMQETAEIAAATYVAQWSNTKNPPTQARPLETRLKPAHWDDMHLTGVMDDEQGKFNLNDLVYSANQPHFVALLQAVVRGISPQAANAIAQAITDWMTTGTQDRYYLSLHPPYRSSQTLMATIGELQLINGVTPAIFSALSPYVTALPVQLPSQSQPIAQPQTTQSTAAAPQTPININSASAPALLAVNPSLTPYQALQLVTCRKNAGEFADTNTFIARCAQPLGITGLSDITVKSEYFLAETQAVMRDRVLTLNSLLAARVQKNGKLKVMVVWQAFE